MNYNEMFDVGKDRYEQLLREGENERTARRVSKVRRVSKRTRTTLARLLPITLKA